MPVTHLIDSASLVPPAWRAAFASGPIRCFNPALLRDGEGWIFANRVVGPDGVRRIALCRLDRELRPDPASAVPFSDRVRFPASSRYSERTMAWFADPRLYRFAGRLYVYWNSGWHEPHNHQFLQEIDPSGFGPIGPPRELRLRGERRPIEKNWMLFGEDPGYALYSLSPQRVLQFSLAGDGPIDLADLVSHPVDHSAYARAYGELRGGAPPQRVGDAYVAIGHSVFGTPGHYRYVAAACRFSAQPPFAPLSVPARPLELGYAAGPARDHPPLNPAIAEVAYPCGAVQEAGHWWISYGINDERCAIAQLSAAEVESALAPAVTA